MHYPRIEINLEKIKSNTEIMVKACKKRGISVAGVTKVFCGNPDIARAYIEGGGELLADSRVENFKKLSELPIPKMLLRIPAKSQVEDVVRFADISLVSEPSIVKELSMEALKQNKTHSIILMIDLGDLREGIFFEDEVYEAIDEILALPEIMFQGIGTNLSCYGGVIPTEEILEKRLNIKDKIKSQYKLSVPIVSGGNSGVLSLFEKAQMPDEINQLRLGAALTMGIGLNDEPIPGLFGDAFPLLTEVIEIRNKPSVPVGEIGLDAFGNKPTFKDKGIRRRAICNIGRQDIDPKNLIPTDSSIEVLGGSSDHLILDVTRSEKSYAIGDIISFHVTYGGCLSAMTSEYVSKSLTQ